MKFETFCEITFYPYTPHAQGHYNEAIYYVTRLDVTTSNWCLWLLVTLMTDDRDEFR